MADAVDLTAIRLLINDPDPAPAAGDDGFPVDPLFTDDELGAFLVLEGGNVKRAAAQAIDTIADNEALIGKALRTKDQATDGAKVADSLRKRAASLRAQADVEVDAEDGGFFQIIPSAPACGPELVNPYHSALYWH